MMRVGHGVVRKLIASGEFASVLIEFFDSCEPEYLKVFEKCLTRARCRNKVIPVIQNHQVYPYPRHRVTQTREVRAGVPGKKDCEVPKKRVRDLTEDELKNCLRYKSLYSKNQQKALKLEKKIRDGK